MSPRLVVAPELYAPLSGGAVIAGGPFAGLPDLSAAFTFAERQLVASRVLARCDGLDGVVDGLVQRTRACQARFSLQDDVPTCPAERDGTCLTQAQKTAIGNIFAGARTSTGAPIYSGFPFDSGLTASDIPFWEFISPLLLDPGAVGFVFGTPPQNPATFIPPLFALTSNVDNLFASIFATTPVYTESGESFATPPALENFGKKGRRMVLYHGVSDPIFSPDDTVGWFEGFDQSAQAQNVARLFLVPGMSHCSGGPTTDQFDLLTPLVRWVEQGEPPSSVDASARGASNPGGANPDLPAAWSADRTRPLCPFPKVAVYTGGNVERADSFDCQ